MQKNRTLACCFNSLAVELDVQFKLEPTSLSSIKYIVTKDEFATIVGMLDGDHVYFCGDRVEVTGDIRGYISPGISHPGLGRIAEIRHHDTDYFIEIVLRICFKGFITKDNIKTIGNYTTMHIRRKIHGKKVCDFQ